jgi:hypothetical protein
MVSFKVNQRLSGWQSENKKIDFSSKFNYNTQKPSVFVTVLSLHLTLKVNGDMK